MHLSPRFPGVLLQQEEQTEGFDQKALYARGGGDSVQSEGTKRPVENGGKDMNMPVVSKKRGGLRPSRLILVALLFMATALIYVWFRIGITNIDYRIAGEMHRRDTLLEENRKLKIEIATLKSPRRIESIARAKLGMSYPERDQVIFLR